MKKILNLNLLLSLSAAIAFTGCGTKAPVVSPQIKQLQYENAKWEFKERKKNIIMHRENLKHNEMDRELRQF